MVAVGVSISTTSNDIDGSFSKEGLFTISPWELLVTHVHVRVDGVGWVTVFNSCKAIDDSYSDKGNSSSRDLGPFANLAVEFFRGCVTSRIPPWHFLESRTCQLHRLAGGQSESLYKGHDVVGVLVPALYAQSANLASRNFLLWCDAASSFQFTKRIISI